MLGVLEAEGVSIARSLGGLPTELLEILKFDTLTGAAEAIARLDALRAAGNPDGVLAARRAREHADLTARNPKVRASIRTERAEIALWFRIWLQTPEAFPAWLEVRRRSPEFAARFLA